MIGKITIGKSFRGCLLYCLNDKIPQHENDIPKQNRAEILMFNHCYGNQKELIQQFNEVRELNPRLSKPVMHITLSLAPGENVVRDKLMEMVHHCATDLGFANNQYLAIHHNDTNHQHLHIVANRVGYDGRTVSDSNSYRKISDYCRKMELKYQLQQVLSPKRYLSREQRQLSRHDKRKEQMREHIRQSLHQSRYYHEFELRMKEKGYQVIKGRGISFIDEKKIKVKGSELNYSLQIIERILERNRSLGWRQKPDPFKLAANNLNPGSSRSEENQPKDYSSWPMKDLSAMVTQVIKPEESSDQTPKELLGKKKSKKRRQSRHL